MNITSMILLLVLNFMIYSCAQTFSTSSSHYSGHGADSLSDETLQKFSPKPIPVQELDTIEKMLDIRKTSLGMLTDNGKELIFNWSVTGVSQVWKIRGPQKFPIQLTAGQDRTLLKGITPNGKWLILSRDRKGNEYPGLFLQKKSGGPLITIYQKSKVQVFYQFMTLDGKYLYFRANDEDPSSYSFYKYNLRTRKKEKIFAGKGYWIIADYFHATQKFLFAKWKSNTASEYYTFDEKTKKLTPLLGQNEQEEYVVKFASTDQSFLVQTNKFSEFRKLYLYRSGKYKNIITPKAKFDVDGFSIDTARTKVIVDVNNQGYHRVWAYSLKTFDRLPVPGFKKAIQVYFGATTRNGRYTTLGVETAKFPRINYVYDWKRQKLTQWTFPSFPEVDNKNFVKETLEHYVAEDGTKIPMFVYRSSYCQQNLCPVLVNFHGGPESQAIPRFSTLTQLLMKKNFIVVKPNVRGSDGYGKTWLHADNRAKRLKVITDIRDCGLWIKKHWKKKGQSPKVGVFGGSYGGYSTFMAMTKFAGTYEAGSAIVGMSSLITFLENTASYRRALRESEYGYLKTDRKILKKLSPITYIQQVKDPIQIIHGATDPRVPAGESVQIYHILKDKNLPVELTLFPDEGHGIRKRTNWAKTVYYIINFFEKHLKKT